MERIPTIIEHRIAFGVRFLWVVQGQGAKLPIQDIPGKCRLPAYAVQTAESSYRTWYPPERHLFCLNSRYSSPETRLVALTSDFYPKSTNICRHGRHLRV